MTGKIPAMEAEGDYIVKMIDKVLREDIRSVCIKPAAEKAFCDYADAWMPRSICGIACGSGDMIDFNLIRDTLARG